jgi:F-type H+-transporting ATPase subunit b
MKELGIQPILLIAQIVNFLIIFYLLKRFLFKPILTMLDKRKLEITENLERADGIAKEEEKIKEKQEKMLADAKREAKTIIEQAKKQQDVLKKEAMVKAHEEAQEIIAKSKAQAEKNTKDQEEQMRKQAVELASAMVTKLVPEILSSDDHKKLIEAHLKDLEKRVQIIN